MGTGLCLVGCLEASLASTVDANSSSLSCDSRKLLQTSLCGLGTAELPSAENHCLDLGLDFPILKLMGVLCKTQSQLLKRFASIASLFFCSSATHTYTLSWRRTCGPYAVRLADPPCALSVFITYKQSMRGLWRQASRQLRLEEDFAGFIRGSELPKSVCTVFIVGCHCLGGNHGI